MGTRSCPCWSSGTGGSHFTVRSRPLPAEGQQCACPVLPPPPSSASCLPITSPTASSKLPPWDTLPPWDMGHFSHCAAWLPSQGARQGGDSSGGRKEDIPQNLASLYSETLHCWSQENTGMFLPHRPGCRPAVSSADCQKSKHTDSGAPASPLPA